GSHADTHRGAGDGTGAPHRDACRGVDDLERGRPTALDPETGDGARPVGPALEARREPTDPDNRPGEDGRSAVRLHDDPRRIRPGGGRPRGPPYEGRQAGRRRDPLDVDDAGTRLSLQDDELDPRGLLEPDAERGAFAD